jgi:hypothetical protein
VLSFSILAPSSRAGTIVSTIGPFDEPPDFSGNYPLAMENLGTFSFSPVNFTVATVTISGYFGNEDVPGTTNVTADSDYFVDGTSIEVASCDSPSVSTQGYSLPCDAGNSTDTPTPWSDTLSTAQIASLSSAFAAGSLDFNVIQNYYGAIETGPITLQIASAPEPGTFYIISLGLLGIGLARRRRL